MTILWCGGEDIDFSCLNVTNSGTAYRAGYARHSMACSVTGSLTAKGVAFPGGPVTSLWLSARGGFSVGTVTNAHPLGLGRTGVTGGIFVGPGATSTLLALYKFDSTGLTWSTVATGSIPCITGNNKYDINVQNYGASATITVYVDGVLALTYSGNLLTTGITNLDCVQLQGTSGGYTSFFSEIIVADEDTRTMSLVTLAPSAAGDANAWTGAYTDINETTNNDATTVSTNTPGADAQFQLTDLPAGLYSIKAIKIGARAVATPAAAAKTLSLGFKTAGTVYPQTAITIPTTWTTVEQYTHTNPATGTAFSTTDINALQLNLRAGA